MNRNDFFQFGKKTDNGYKIIERKDTHYIILFLLLITFVIDM